MIYLRITGKEWKIIGDLCRLPSAVNVMLKLSIRRFVYLRRHGHNAFSLEETTTHTISIGIRAPSDLGGRWAYCPKKITKCLKASVVYTYSNGSKNKEVPKSHV